MPYSKILRTLSNFKNECIKEDDDMPEDLSDFQ
jgi:hypothetical protein